MKYKQLRDFKRGGRFCPSIYKCPKCNGEALEDQWPPNYGGSNGWTSETGSCWTSSGYIKHVCEACRIAFGVGYKRVEVTQWGSPTQVLENEIAYRQITPLVLDNGQWLTPSDVDDERYKEQHGEYPIRAYA